MQSGDEITLDVAGRRLQLHVSEAELAQRRAAWEPAERSYRGGYETLYVTHVQQADKGADFDFLVGRRGAAVPRESH